MITVRLYVDGVGKGWAIVRCDACTEVDKYPAIDAFDAPVKCKCGQQMNVRDALMAEVMKRSNAARELANAVGGTVDPGAIVPAYSFRSKSDWALET